MGLNKDWTLGQTNCTPANSSCRIEERDNKMSRDHIHTSNFGIFWAHAWVCLQLQLCYIYILNWCGGLKINTIPIQILNGQINLSIFLVA